VVINQKDTITNPPQIGTKKSYNKINEMRRPLTGGTLRICRKSTENPRVPSSILGLGIKIVKGFRGFAGTLFL